MLSFIRLLTHLLTHSHSDKFHHYKCNKIGYAILHRPNAMLCSIGYLQSQFLPQSQPLSSSVILSQALSIPLPKRTTSSNVYTYIPYSYTLKHTHLSPPTLALAVLTLLFPQPPQNPLLTDVSGCASGVFAGLTVIPSVPTPPPRPNAPRPR